MLAWVLAHPPVWAECKVHHPWALFCEATVYVHNIVWLWFSFNDYNTTLFDPRNCKDQPSMKIESYEIFSLWDTLYQQSFYTGALAMEALHRQVLPFLLRRMKEDVLQDLPPKIIQDYHCELSPLQVCSWLIIITVASKIRKVHWICCFIVTACMNFQNFSNVFRFRIQLQYSKRNNYSSLSPTHRAL